MPWLVVERGVWGLLEAKTRARLETQYAPLFKDVVADQFRILHERAAKAHDRSPTVEEAEAATIAFVRGPG